MRFFTLSTIAALMAVATVHAAPVGTEGAKQLVDNVAGSAISSSPIPLNTSQLTQCLTQIVENGAKTCNLSLLNGLTATVLGLVDSTVGNLLVINDRILDLNSLTVLVTKATSILNDKGETVNVDSVLVTVQVLVKSLPVGQVTPSILDGVVKRGDLVSGTLDTVNNTVGQILAPSGLSLNQVKALVGQTLVDLNVEPVVKGLTGEAKATVCKTLTNLNIDCEQILSVLAKQGSLI
ncbi:hypothetical protein BDC45DRAFT_502346 [Circinella umbellata]|nr:hypothetical protein BDC45DRAFT_502346 [Circinella umbellata]